MFNKKDARDYEPHKSEMPAKKISRKDAKSQRKHGSIVECFRDHISKANASSSDQVDLRQTGETGPGIQLDEQKGDVKG